MSDQNPFGGPASTAVAEPGTEETPEVSSRPKPIVFVVGGAVLLVLAIAAYFLLFSGGGSDSTAGAVVPSKAHVSTVPSAKAVPSSVPSVVAAGGLTGSGTDPFRAAPVVSAPASASASASGTASGSTGTGAGSTSGVTSTLTVNSVNFSTNSATVTVDGKSYVAHAGAETFATYYQLRVVIQGSAQCAVFVFGDVPAQLCKGQSATFKG